MAAPLQAQLGNYQTARDFLKVAGRYGTGGIAYPPNIIVAAGEALPKAEGDKLRIIQNLGTKAVKCLIADASDADVNNFHYVLAPCVAVDDGYGGAMDFSFTAERVSICTVDGSAPRVAVLRVGYNQ